ncbi:MAG: hypothetical protein KAG97_00490 [Victivallales bacterium]|nr:hypothetical protein [Victivallales bacterium]
MFPKKWGVTSGKCEITKTSNGNAVTFGTGTIYTYLGEFFQNPRTGELVVTAELKGKGKAYSIFSLWSVGDKGKRLNPRSVKTKPVPLSDTNKPYVFKCDVKPGEVGYFYLYVNGELTVYNVSAVAIGK